MMNMYLSKRFNRSIATLWGRDGKLNYSVPFLPYLKNLYRPFPFKRIVKSLNDTVQY